MKAAVRSSFGFSLMVLVASACQPVAQSPEPYRQPPAATNASLLGTWQLVSVDGLAVRPKAVNVTFDRAGAFTAMVDCNKAQGYYSFTGAQLSFVGWIKTERGCEAPLEHEKLIEQALVGDGYAVALTSSELHLSGPHTVIFRRL
jgi:heat shock protein HslJ